MLVSLSLVAFADRIDPVYDADRGEEEALIAMAEVRGETLVRCDLPADLAIQVMTDQTPSWMGAAVLFTSPDISGHRVLHGPSEDGWSPGVPVVRVQFDDAGTDDASCTSSEVERTAVRIDVDNLPGRAWVTVPDGRPQMYRGPLVVDTAAPEFRIEIEAGGETRSVPIRVRDGATARVDWFVMETLAEREAKYRRELANDATITMEFGAAIEIQGLSSEAIEALEEMRRNQRQTTAWKMGGPER